MNYKNNTFKPCYNTIELHQNEIFTILVSYTDY